MFCAYRSTRAVGLATRMSNPSPLTVVSSFLCRRSNIAQPLSRSLVYYTSGLSVNDSMSQSLPSMKQLASQAPSSSKSLSTNSDNKLDLDTFCEKHMELPEQDFVLGCSFLYQVALGRSQAELERKFNLSNNHRLVNFRDYDRRTGVCACACVCVCVCVYSIRLIIIFLISH